MRARPLMYVEFFDREIDALTRAFDRTGPGREMMVEDGTIDEVERRVIGSLRGSNFKDPMLLTEERMGEAILILMLQRQGYENDIAQPIEHWFRPVHAPGVGGGPGSAVRIVMDEEKAVEVLRGARREMIDEIDRALAIFRSAIDAIRAANALWEPIEPPMSEEDAEESREREDARAEARKRTRATKLRRIRQETDDKALLAAEDRAAATEATAPLQGITGPQG